MADPWAEFNMDEQPVPDGRLPVMAGSEGGDEAYGGGGVGTGKPLRVNISPDGQAEGEAGDPWSEFQMDSAPVKTVDVPPSEDAPSPTWGGSFQNAAAAAAQGPLSIVDAGANAVGAVMGEAARYGSRAIGAGADALGYDGESIRQAGETARTNFYNPITPGGLIERIAPTPDDVVGKGVRIAGQFGGGMLTIPGITPFAKSLPKILGLEAPKSLLSRITPGPAAQGVDIVDEGAKAGVRVLTSDVKPPQTFIGKTAQATGERVIGMGTGGVRQAQQAERIGAVKNLLADFGADDVARSLTDDVAADLAKTRGAELTKLTKAKNMVIDKFDDAVATPNAVKAIDDQIANLKGINADAYAEVIAKLESFKGALQSGKSLRQIEGNRRLLGDMFKDPNLAAIRGDGEKALNAIYSPLRDDMGNFIKQKGGQADFTRWKSANDRLAAMAGELDAAGFKRALQSADVTPENVANILFSKKPSEVARLYANLSPKGQAKAQAAILQRAMEKAGGLDNLSPDKFVNEIERLGKNVGVVFQGDDLARVNGLAKLLNATQRAATASVSPPTGVQNAMTGLYGGAGVLGGIEGLAAVQGYGLLARAYESVAVRNLLLKLGKAKAGSVHERTLTTKVIKAIGATQGGKVAEALNDNIGVGSRAVANEKDGQENR